MSEINDEVFKALGDPELALPHRKQLAIDLLVGAGPDGVEQILNRMSSKALDEDMQMKMMEVNDMIDNIQRAPMKPATFIELTTLEGSNSPHATVLMDNGEFGYMVVHNSNDTNRLKLGDRVALDGKAKILVGKITEQIMEWGNEARFERRLNSQYIEVTRRDERIVVLTHRGLMDKIEAESVKSGDQVVISAAEKIAVMALPTNETIGHYRFLDRGPIPDVLVDRDIGAPPRVIEDVSRHVQEEMTRPALRRRFRLRPCITRLLSGVSGSGKTLAVQAIHRRIYDIMSDVTGTKPAALPHRVFRFKTSQVLSMWLGESDKNADRLFDEIEELAKQTFSNEKGKEFKLPVIVIMEEAEGMGRQRGDTHDSVYDRILSTLLQRLDPNRAGLSDQLVVFLSTTNEPHLVDPAFLRRIGGSVERFGRLNREAFVDVLKKHVEGLPAQNGNGKTQKKLWKDIGDELESWLYEGGESAIIDVQLADRSNVKAYRRDFLTGALIVMLFSIFVISFTSFL